MAATRTNLGSSNAAVTDLGGTITTGDTLIFSQGNNDLNSNLDLSAGNTVDLASAEFLPGWSGDVPAGTPLKIVASTGKVLIAWGGRFFYLESYSAATTIAQLTVNAARAGRVFIANMIASQLNVYGASFVQAVASATVTAAILAGNSNTQLLDPAGPTLTSLIASERARATVERPTTLFDISGNAVVDVTKDAVTPTDVYLRGGQLNYGGGNITNLYLYGGPPIDMTKLTKALTVANLYAYAPMTILLSRSGPGISFTATPVNYAPVVLQYV